MEQNVNIEIQKIGIFGLVSNIFLAIIKWTAGILGHSYALIADAMESTLDIVSSLIVLFGLKYASKPADEDHPYGHGRIEPIITFLIVVMMLVSTTIIVIESIEHILIPHKLPAFWTLYILAGVILTKEISYHIIRNKGKRLGNSALQAEAMHHRSDAFTSIAAFIGISLAIYLGEGYEYMDDIAALIAGVLITYNAFKIFRPAWGEIMDENTYDSFKEEICSSSNLFEEIQRIEKCHIRKVGGKLLINMHMEVDGSMTVRKGHELSHRYKDYLLEKYPSIGDVLIHIEPSYEKHGNSMALNPEIQNSTK